MLDRHFRAIFLRHSSGAGISKRFWLVREREGDKFIYHHPHSRPDQSSEGRADRNSSGACRWEQYYSAVFISDAFSEEADGHNIKPGSNKLRLIMMPLSKLVLQI